MDPDEISLNNYNKFQNCHACAPLQSQWTALAVPRRRMYLLSMRRLRVSPVMKLAHFKYLIENFVEVRTCLAERVYRLHDKVQRVKYVEEFQFKHYRSTPP